MTTIPTPVEISDISMAFPADALDYMPPMEEIPEAFQRETEESAPWYEFQKTWFSLGLSQKFLGFIPAEIDGTRLEGEKVFRQLSAIQGSYAPKHEHKMAAVAYLASIWMDALSYTKKDGTLEDLKVAGEIPLQGWIEHWQAAEQEDSDDDHAN